jgi:hypothetical protein
MVRRFVCFLAAACAASAAVRSIQITERTPVLDGDYEEIPELARQRFVMPQDREFIIERAARLWNALAK